MPPAPLKVSSPEAADNPAPQSARTRFDDLKTSLNSWISVLGPKDDLGGVALVDAIVRMYLGREV